MSLTKDDEAAIERAINDKGLNAPRLKPESIDAQIVAEDYHVFPGTTLTVCCLTLRNGFQVSGTSAAASPENFDQAIGRTIARKNAREKIWELEGYRLKQALFDHRLGANIHGIGPDEAGGPNPDYKPAMEGQ